MTKEQLYALKNYILQVTEIKTDLKIYGSVQIEQWQIDLFEKTFDEIMLGTADGGEK